MADSTIRPFCINIAEDELDDLGRRLAATRWPEAETADGWNQGLPLDYARDLCSYWQLEYPGVTANITSTHFRNFRLSSRVWIFTSFM